jgi:hypothetical protein
MRVLKYIFCAILVSVWCNSLLAQTQNSLLFFYKGLAFSPHHGTSPIDDGLRTSSYYPLKATNYIWNISGSVWDFTDTTLYTYSPSADPASLTKKDNANNFISRVLNSYDASDNLIEALNQVWSSGWVNDFRDTFAYDSNNSLTLQENHQWNTNQWVRAGGYRYFYTYNGGGKILTMLTLTWNTTTLVWDTVSKLTHSYNGNNQLVQTIGESYNLSLNAWELISKRDYVYNASSVNTQTIEYLWSGTQWVNNTQIINITWHTWTGDVITSDPQNYIYQLWGGSSWNNFNRLTYTYDSFGGVIQFTELFVSGNWRNDARLSEFYDNQYNYTGIRSESWDIFTTSWDTAYEYKYIYTYDVNNAITESIYQEYDVPNHVFQNNSRKVYSDFIFLDVDVEETISPIRNTAIIYPNPFTDFAEVAVQEKNNSVHYTIYDSSGKIVAAGEEKNHFRIRKAGLSEGLYLLQISDREGANHFLRFIVQ